MQYKMTMGWTEHLEGSDRHLTVVVKYDGKQLHKKSAHMPTASYNRETCAKSIFYGMLDSGVFVLDEDIPF